MRAALAHLAELAGRAPAGRRARRDGRARRARAAEFHREVGRRGGRSGVAALVAVGPLAREYAAPPASGGARRDADEAAEALRELLRPGDVVLIKGSRAVGLEAVAAKLRG